MEHKTDKLVCRVNGTRFIVQTIVIPSYPEDPSLQRLFQGMQADGILRASRQADGSFDCDSEAGCQRFCCTKGARAVGNALRRLGFSHRQSCYILRETRQKVHAA